MNRKCAIFNFWWSWKDAHGASLTALALYKLIEELGYDPCLIMTVFRGMNEEQCKEGRHFKFIEKYAKYTEKNYQTGEAYAELNEQFEHFIVGSDQVFRVEWVQDEWFLYSIRSDKNKIAMSASFGTNELTASEKRINRVAKHLKDFSAISVREKDGIEVFERYFGHRDDIEWIMDPVFLIDPSFYYDLMNNHSKNYGMDTYSKEIIFWYILDSTPEIRRLKEKISRLYDVIIVEDSQDLMAEDFLYLVANCKMMITDSFHGLCFSVILNKPFYCIYNNTRGISRVATIRELFGLGHVIFDSGCIDACDFHVPEINYTEINRIIEIERKRGREWLRYKLDNHKERNSDIMRKFILFGAGAYAEKAIALLGKEEIEMILDNDSSKWGRYIAGIPICSPEAKKEVLADYQVIVAVSQKYQQQILEQLRQAGIRNIRTIQEVQTEITKRKLENRLDYINIYDKAAAWIKNNTVDGQAIICNTDKRTGYPEVTGYYIPTLLRWGYRDLAVSYAKWLCGIQKEDGSWYDTDGNAPYVFDSAQILKGLMAIRTIYPQADAHIIKGCDWIISNMQESGRLSTPSTDAWGDGRTCSELIHMYCLSPLVQATEVFGMPQYKEAAYKILEYYKQNHYEEIMNFRLLSHFYAYVMEALLDMGEKDMAVEAMAKIEKIQKDNGAVPAYHDVNWVCSTGLFQLALVWFRLGNIESGNKAFEYACRLQNESGGWYGSYLSENDQNEDNTYFPTSEISWAVKYFLDALYYKNLAEFDLWSSSFMDGIDRDDGRYKIIREAVSSDNKSDDAVLKVLDVGCGKGRYLKNLIQDEPGNRYYAMDLSESVMDFISEAEISRKQGSLTNIDYPDDYFDVVYTCEALEHAVDIKNAIKELSRVTRDGGKIVIIDKNREQLGRMEIGEWEVWFDADVLKDMMLKYCSSVTVTDQIEYEHKKEDKLFLAWIGTVSKSKKK